MRSALEGVERKKHAETDFFRHFASLNLQHDELNAMVDVSPTVLYSFFVFPVCTQQPSHKIMEGHAAEHKRRRQMPKLLFPEQGLF
jgi:hypothetical protein